MTIKELKAKLDTMDENAVVLIQVDEVVGYGGETESYFKEIFEENLSYYGSQLQISNEDILVDYRLDEKRVLHFEKSFFDELKNGEFLIVDEWGFRGKYDKLDKETITHLENKFFREAKNLPCYHRELIGLPRKIQIERYIEERKIEIFIVNK